jgi:hypothetical protein
MDVADFYRDREKGGLIVTALALFHQIFSQMATVFYLLFVSPSPSLSQKVPEGSNRWVRLIFNI